MNLGFFAPLVFGGLALLAVPWLIHRIRKPEREPVRFSSLMFVPNVKKEVIERRRIQHLLLMLMRMGLVALLAFAFARPFWQAVAMADSSETVRNAHVILLDTSMSMSVGDRMIEARRKAAAIVDNLRGQDTVAVVTFADRPEIRAAFNDENDPQAGTPARARAAIESARPGYTATQYLPAMQEAERLLLSQLTEEESDELGLVLHLVSDFHRSGMPAEASSWKLASQITFDPVEIAGDAPSNDAIQDYSIREKKNGDLEIRAKVKNWRSEGEHETQLQLLEGDTALGENLIRVKAGNATQTLFTLPGRAGESLRAQLVLPEDGLEGDNRRFVAWSPEAEHPLAIADSPEAASARFIELALGSGDDTPWSPTTSAPDEWLTADPAARPDIAVVAQAGALNTSAVSRLEEFVLSGGSALVLLEPGISSGDPFAAWLDESGIEVLGPAHETPRESVFDLMSWVDFDHPIFAPFRGPRFNDFSSIRFYNHARLRIDSDMDTIRAIARFETDAPEAQDPAMLDLRLGEGRLVVWAFDLELTTSSLTRNIRFVPFVLETLNVLGGAERVQRAYTTGDAIAAPPGGGDAWSVRLPGLDDAAEWSAEEFTGAKSLLPEPGHIVWERDGDSESIVEPVNVPVDESDPEAIPMAEFEIKLCAAPVLDRESEGATAQRSSAADEFVVNYEYGRWIVALMAALFLVESWYAARLSQ